MTTINPLTVIGNGLAANDGTGDTLRTGAAAINANSAAIVTAINNLAASQSAGAVSYLTKADMDADLAHPDGTIALVTNDSTAANNQAWRKSGASGSGSWTATIDRIAAVLGNGAGFQQSGAGSVLRTFQDKGRDTKHIRDFLTNAGDGVTDVLGAIVKANTYLSSIGGGVLEFGEGIHPISGTYAHPANVIFRGKGKQSTILRRTSTADFCSSLGSNAGIELMTIDGAGSAYTSGDGIVVPAGKFGQHISHAEVINFPANCLHFNADGGSQMCVSSSTLYTLGAVGSVGAIKVDAGDSASVPRHFTDLESNGCTLYDFTGSNDTFVTGGYTNGIIFGTGSSKVFISNLRIGAAAGTVTIQGGSHVITNVVSAAAIVLGGTNHVINIQSPGYAITDNSTGSYVVAFGGFTPVWSGATTAPAIGNGTLRGRYSRVGQLVTLTVEVIMGSTTTFGSGAWGFSLPFKGNSSLNQVCAAGFNTGSGTTNKTFSAQIVANSPTLDLRYVDPTTGVNVIGSGTRAWTAGDTLRFTVLYQSN